MGGTHVYPWPIHVQFSHSVLSDSLRPHELQHARPPCPSSTPRVHPNPCPLSWWCHATISSSVVPVSSCPKSFPASGSFQMSQLFTSGAQSIGVSASKSVLPMNTQDWSISFRMDWLDLLAVQEILKSLLQHHSSKASILLCSVFFTVQLSHPYMTTGKTIALTRRTFVGKVMSLLLNMLFNFLLVTKIGLSCNHQSYTESVSGLNFFQSNSLLSHPAVLFPNSALNIPALPAPHLLLCLHFSSLQGDSGALLSKYSSTLNFWMNRHSTS